MELFMDGFQTALFHMGVDLGGRNIGVPQHFLDDPQIGPVSQKMGGKRMSQKMGINVDFNSAAGRNLFYDLPNPLGCQLLPVPGQENFVAGLAANQSDSFLGQIPINRFTGHPSDRHQPGLRPFADHSNDSFPEDLNSPGVRRPIR